MDEERNTLLEQRFLQKAHIRCVKTIGLNPHAMTKECLLSDIERLMAQLLHMVSMAGVTDNVNIP